MVWLFSAAIQCPIDLVSFHYWLLHIRSTIDRSTYYLSSLLSVSPLSHLCVVSMNHVLELQWAGASIACSNCVCARTRRRDVRARPARRGELRVSAGRRAGVASPAALRHERGERAPRLGVLPGLLLRDEARRHADGAAAYRCARLALYSCYSIVYEYVSEIQNRAGAIYRLDLRRCVCCRSDAAGDAEPEDGRVHGALLVGAADGHATQHLRGEALGRRVRRARHHQPHGRHHCHPQVLAH